MKKVTEVEKTILDELYAIQHDLDNIHVMLKYVFVAGIFLIIGGIII